MFDLKVRSRPLGPTPGPLSACPYSYQSQARGQEAVVPPERPDHHKHQLTTSGTQGKAKKNAWQKKVDEGVTADQAKEQYVALVEKLKTQYGYDENKQPEAVGN